jgi:hypothetical protein
MGCLPSGSLSPAGCSGITNFDTGSPADEGKENLVDDLGDGAGVAGAEQERAAKEVEGESGNSLGDVVACFAAFGGSLEDGRHGLVSGLHQLGLEVGDEGGIGEIVSGQAIEGLRAEDGEPGGDPVQHLKHIPAKAPSVGDLSREHGTVAAQGSDDELMPGRPPAGEYRSASSGPLGDPFATAGAPGPRTGSAAPRTPGCATCPSRASPPTSSGAKSWPWPASRASPAQEN